MLFHQTLDWDEARQACEALPGLTHLADATNNEGLSFLIDLHFDHGPDVWVGANDRDVEDTFVWIATGATVERGDFGEGEPDGGTNENCLAMSPDGWDDEVCFRDLEFICERDVDSGEVDAGPVTGRARRRRGRSRRRSRGRRSGWKPLRLLHWARWRCGLEPAAGLAAGRARRGPVLEAAPPSGMKRVLRAARRPPVRRIGVLVAGPGARLGRAAPGGSL